MVVYIIYNGLIYRMSRILIEAGILMKSPRFAYFTCVFEHLSSIRIFCNGTSLADTSCCLCLIMKTLTYPLDENLLSQL